MENNLLSTREKNKDVFGKKTNRWPVLIVLAVLILAVVAGHFIIDIKQKSDIDDIEKDTASTLVKIAALSRVTTTEEINTGEFMKALPQAQVYSTHTINEEIEDYAVICGISTTDNYSLSTQLASSLPFTNVAQNVFCGESQIKVSSEDISALERFLELLYNAERYYYISNIVLDISGNQYTMACVVNTFYVAD